MSNFISFYENHKLLFRISVFLIVSPFLLILFGYLGQTALEIGRILGTLLRHVHEFGGITC